MNQITLTEQGKEILTATNIDGVSQYWVGYFGLAYVPITNTANPELDPSDANYDPGLKSLSTLIGPNEKGDYIYNIWQGDLTGTGYASEDNEFTKVTLYDSNLSSNFRYHYNESTGQNNLIAWVTDADTSSAVSGLTVESYSRVGYKVYEGCGVSGRNSVSDTNTPEYTDSNIPVPAPLVYLGGELNYSHGDLNIMGHELGADWPLTSGGYPKVTPDMRCYSGKSSTESLTGDDVLSSAAALSRAGSDRLIDDYSCFVSLSNFNKAHAQVSSEGYETDYQESCHNMSRVTKLFPIAKYEIASADAETKETRTGNANTIKYTLELDFAGVNQEYRDVLTFSDKTPSEDPLFGENPKNSFKFNRIGIYAAPVTVRKFRKEGSPECNSCQVEVEPDENPVLVAIISIDDVILSESDGVGFTSWKQDFILNLEHVEPDVTTAMVRDVEIFYNITENEAITWYQNQLLASAGLSEAVTNLGIDVAYLKNIAGMSSSDCIAALQTDETDKYADKDHTHDCIKNLVDANQDAAVRGINSSTATNYGRCSLTMGEDSITTGIYSLSIGPYLNTAGAHNLTLGESASTPGNYSINIGQNSINSGNFSINLGEGASNTQYYAINLSNGSNTGFASINMGLGYLNSPVEGNPSACSILLSPGITVSYASSSLILSASPSGIIESVSNSILVGSIQGSDDTELKNAVIIGEDCSAKTSITNTLIIGDDETPGEDFTLNNVFAIGNSTFSESSDYDTVPVSIERVSVFGYETPYLFGALLSNSLFGTDSYSDAHIFMPSGYSNPAWFGIFPTPLQQNVYATAEVRDIPQTQYIPITVEKFNGENDTYQTTDSYDMWARGKTVEQVHEMINKPPLPMIYTGGIALAGKPIPPETSQDRYSCDDFAARIKLGGGVLPSSYIAIHPIDNWTSSNMIYPVPITGITSCPYGGMLMGIAGTQDLDGTMHIGLYKYPIPSHSALDEGKVLTVGPSNQIMWMNGTGLTSSFEKTAIVFDDIAPTCSISPYAGKRYYTSAYIANDMYLDSASNTMNIGEEFIFLLRENEALNYKTFGYTSESFADSPTLSSTAVIGPGAWLFRKCAYITSHPGSPDYGFIALQLDCNYNKVNVTSRLAELENRVTQIVGQMQEFDNSIGPDYPWSTTPSLNDRVTTLENQNQ